MRKNWLATAWGRLFRAEPLVPDSAFQGREEPYPGHWRHFPEPWPTTPARGNGAEEQTAQQHAAVVDGLAHLPDVWRRVLTAHDIEGRSDQEVADELQLTPRQERDILARARAALRHTIDRAQTDQARTDRPT